MHHTIVESGTAHRIETIRTRCNGFLILALLLQPRCKLCLDARLRGGHAVAAQNPINRYSRTHSIKRSGISSKMKFRLRRSTSVPLQQGARQRELYKKIRLFSGLLGRQSDRCQLGDFIVRERVADMDGSSPLSPVEDFFVGSAAAARSPALLNSFRIGYIINVRILLVPQGP
jgi:hypothetical protein